MYIQSYFSQMVFIAMKLDNNNHSVFRLDYCLVMCTQDCCRVMDEDISDRLKEIFMKISPSYNISLEKWEYDADHVCILFRGQPNTEMSRFINAYKSAGSRLIRKEFPQVKKTLPDGKFWSRSFCLLTAGSAPSDIVDQYIRTQGREHGAQGNQIQAVPNN